MRKKITSGTAMGVDYKEDADGLCIHTWMDGQYSGAWAVDMRLGSKHGTGQRIRDWEV